MGRWTGIGIVFVAAGILGLGALGLVLRQPTGQTGSIEVVATSAAAPSSPIKSTQPDSAVAKKAPLLTQRPAARPASPAVRSSIPEVKPAAANNAPAAAPASSPIESPQASVAPPAASPSPSPATIEPQPIAAPAQTVQATPSKTTSTNVTLKKDTVIGIRLDDAVSSTTAKVDDKISAKVSRDVIVDRVTAIPAGTRLEGTVVHVERPSATTPKGKLAIRFTTLVRSDNTRVTIATDTISREASDPNESASNSFDVNAFSALVAGGNRTAPLRSTAPVQSGSPLPAPPKSREIQLPAGSVMTVHLTAALTITVDRDPQ